MQRISEYIYAFAGNEFCSHRYEDTGASGGQYSYYDITRKCFTQNHTKNSYSVMFVMDDELKKRWEYQHSGEFHCFWFHKDKHYVKPTELPCKIYELKWKDLYNFVKEGWNTKIADSLDKGSDPLFYDKHHKAWLENKQQRLDKINSLPLASLSYNKCDIAHLCAMLGYKLEDTVKACEYTGVDSFYELSTGKLVNNRLWIPIDDTRYFVISKNPADVVWASTGNEFTSCYGLNGDSHAIQSSMACMTQVPWFYMAYITDGSCKEYELFKRKWKLPQMDWRCWCYLTNDGEYILDRRFGKSGSSSECQDEFADILNAIPLKNVLYRFERWQKLELNINTKDYYSIVNRYKCYWDSILPYCNVYDGTHLYFKFMALYQYSRNSGLDRREVDRANVEYNPNLDYKKQITLNSKIFNPTYSEKSQMLCEDGTHWVDRYLERNVKSCVIVTFIENKLYPTTIVGSHRISALGNSKICFNGFDKAKEFRPFISSRESEDPKLFIDNARVWIKSDDNVFWDCIVVRTINDDKIKITPMYAKQNKEFGIYERVT